MATREILLQALQYLWPDGWLLRCRMVLCITALVFSRVCNLLIPLCYKVSQTPNPKP